MARKKQGRQGRARRGRSMARGGAKRSAAKYVRRSAYQARTLGPAAKALAEDHRRVEALFGSYVASADEAEKQKLVEEICAALIVHTAIEEEIFYPACRESLPQDQIMDTAQVEHDGTKILIADLLDGDGDDPYRDAKVEVRRRRREGEGRHFRPGGAARRRHRRACEPASGAKAGPAEARCRASTNARRIAATCTGNGGYDGKRFEQRARARRARPLRQ
jgi:hypothetical protein